MEDRNFNFNFFDVFDDLFRVFEHESEYFNVLSCFRRIASTVLTKTHEPFWNNYKRMQHWVDTTTVWLRYLTLPFRTFIVVGIGLLYIAIMVTEMALIIMIFIFLMACSIAVGILPAFIGAAIFSVITCLQAPLSSYVYLVILYQTVAMTGPLKVTCCIATPILTVLAPPICFVGIFFILFLYCFIDGICGFGHATWLHMPGVIKKFWNCIGQHRKLMQDFHDNGVPWRWNGDIVGFPINPGIVFLSIAGYFIGLVIIAPCIFAVMILKSPLIFMQGVYEFWKRGDPHKFFTWHYKVLSGHKPEQPRNTQRDDPRMDPVGHGKWINCLERWTESSKDDLEDFRYSRRFPILWYDTKCILDKYFDKLTILNFDNLSTPFKAFNKKYPLFTALAGFSFSDMTICWTLAAFLGLLLGGSFAICLWLIYQSIALCFVIAFCVVFLTLWIAFLPVFALMPLARWIFDWVFVLIALPSLYILTWILVFLLPWILTFFYSLSGPFLAINISVLVFKSNVRRPFNDLQRVLEIICGEIKKIIKKSDDASANYSLGNFKLCCCCQINEDPEDPERRGRSIRIRVVDRSNEPGNTTDNGAQVGVTYWKRFFRQMSSTIQTVIDDGWLTSEDIQSMDSSVILSIPSISILTILHSTNERNKDRNKDKVMFYWPVDKFECTRIDDEADNFVKVFKPKLLDIMKDLNELDEADLSTHIKGIKASLCDGDDKKTEALKLELESYDKFLGYENEEHRNLVLSHDQKIAKRIRSKLVGVTLGLTKVNKMQDELKNIFTTSIPEPKPMPMPMPRSYSSPIAIPGTNIPARVDEESVDEELDEDVVNLVMENANCSKGEAVMALKECNNNIINAISTLKMLDVD